MQTPNKKSNPLDTSFQPPPLPPEGEALDVYADYVAALDEYEARIGGYVGWLRGHALLRAKAVSNASIDAIIDTFGWGRSTGHLYKSIAEKIGEVEAKSSTLRDLRAKVYETKPTEPINDDEGECTEPSDDDAPPSCGYSITKAFNDLKAIKVRLEKFRNGIGQTRDKMNETTATANALLSMDTQFLELRTLLNDADKARLEAARDSADENHRLTVRGLDQRLDEVA